MPTIYNGFQSNAYFFFPFLNPQVRIGGTKTLYVYPRLSDCMAVALIDEANNVFGN